MARLAGAITSDLGLHGFVYLGVLLTFVGVFGFLFFSFKDVPDDAQPLVELVIPLIFFVWAWVLGRRQAVLIGRAMELLGGVMLPIVLFAGLVDNAPFPPDLRGGALIVGMAVTSLIISSAYAWWSARRLGSALCYLVAPAIWLSAMVLGFVFKTDEPLVGVAITRLVSFQPALSSAAIAATLGALAIRPGHRLAQPSTLAALPGVAVAYMLTVALAAGERWVRPTPIILAGASTLISSELLGRRFGMARSMSALRPFLLAATLAPLIPLWGLAWSGAAAVAAYLALIEWDVRADRRSSLSVPIALAGVVVGLAMSVIEPWPAVAAWATASGWSHVRRAVGIPLERFRPTLAFAAAIFPFGLGSGLLRALPDDLAWLVMAVVLASAVTAVRRVRSDEAFWAYWLRAAATVVTIGPAATWYLDRREMPSPPVLVAVTTLAAAVLAVTPRWPGLRVWMASGAMALSLAIGFDAGSISEGVEPALWALAGLAAVIAAAIWRRGVAGHLGAVGHVVGLGSLVVAASATARVVVLVAWAVGWLATVVSEETGGASAGKLIERNVRRITGLIGERLSRTARAIPSVVLAASVPPAVVEWVGLWDTFAQNRAWSGVALALLSLVYATSARRLVERKPISSVLASAAVVLSVIGVAVSAPVPWPSIAASASSIIVAALLFGELRRAAFTWFAWIMSGVLTMQLANRAGVPVRLIHLVALVWGGLLLIGGLALDDIRAGRRRRGEGLRLGWLRHPVVLGALAVPISLGPTFSQSSDVFGWWSLGAAACYLVVAYQLRAGAVAGPAYALATVGVTALLPKSPMSRPWIFVVLAAALVGCSWAAERRQSRSGAVDRWLRWDFPPLVVAHLVAAVALARAAQIGAVASTSVGFGVLSLVIALWRLNRAWAETGHILVVIGAGAAGPEWLALALVGTSVRGVVSAALTTGRRRIFYQVLTVAAAGWAWIETVLWQGWATPQVVSYSALVFGALAALVGALARFAKLPLDWAVAWGALAVVGTLATAAAAPNDIVDLFPALGTGLFALGSGLAARPLRLVGLEALTVAAVGTAWAKVIAGVPWSVDQAVPITSLAAGGLAISIAMLARFARLPRSWCTSWGVLAVVALATAWRFSFERDWTPRAIGPGLAGGVALLAVASAVAARPLWPSLHYFSVAGAAWAWMALVLGLGWRRGASSFLTALAFGLLSVVVAEVVRLRGRTRAHLPVEEDRPSGRDIGRAWGALAAVGVAAGGLLAPLLERRPTWLAVAGGMGLLALGSAKGAVPLAWPWLRETSGLVALGAMTALGYGLDASAAGLAAGAIAVGMAATLIAIVLWRGHAVSPWLRPLALTGVVADFEALILAAGTWPRRDVLVAVLLAFGVQAVAAGLTLQRPGILSLGPPLVCIAWLGIASESLTGRAQWYTAPIGLTMLAEVEVARWTGRLGRHLAGTGQLLVLEWAGIGLLALSPLAEMFTGGVGVGLLAFASAAGLLLWAIMTRVRRRAIAAGVLATVTAVLMVFAAAAGSAPPSAFFWIVAAGAGFAVMLAIALVEAYRSKSGRIMLRMDQLMEGWE